jgi:hypothetical protein
VHRDHFEGKNETVNKMAYWAKDRPDKMLETFMAKKL